jgi:hypothetical protein
MFYEIDSRGLYSTLRMRNLLGNNKYFSKLVYSGFDKNTSLDKQNTNLLRSP